MDYCAVALKYSKDVVAGRVPACEYVRLACARHISDLALQKNREYPFKFDKEKGNRVCRFIEKLPHTKGSWASRGERLRLEPWQVFIITTAFGWVVKKTNFRRFREVYVEVPRKNGKSILSSGVGLYMFCADGEFGAEVYSGATSEKQAWEVFRPARLMCTRTPDLVEYFDFEVNAKSLVRPSDGSRFEPIIGRPGDGSSPSCAIIDEFHEHVTSDMYDTMSTGMGSRDQPMLWIITTAGVDAGGPCYQRRLDVIKILRGVIHDDRVFGVIYSLDDGDDWKDHKCMAKANPNLGVSVLPEYLEMQLSKAISSPAKQNIVRTKHFNVWVGSRDAWTNMEHWRAAGNSELREEDFADCQYVQSVDLASRIDICAKGKLYWRVEDDGRFHYYWFPTFYIPEEALDNSRQAARYRGWVSQGCLFTHDGQEINFNEIQEEILNTENPDMMEEFVYDPWRATQLAQNLEAEGVVTVEYRQTVQNMSPPMFELEAALAAGRFHHNSNPVMDWMAGNVTAKIDAKSNVYPRKDSQESKIDGMIALIVAVGLAMHRDDTDISKAIENPLRASR